MIVVVELGSRRSYLLFYSGGGGGVERGREGLLVSDLKTFVALLLQALLALALANLHHVVLAMLATLIGFYRHLVLVTAVLGSLGWPQWHGYEASYMFFLNIFFNSFNYKLKKESQNGVVLAHLTEISNWIDKN